MPTLSPDTITTPSIEELEKLWNEAEPAKPYNLIILDDDVNTMDYVVKVFKDYFGLDEWTATMKMLEVHNMGRSVLAQGSQEEMEGHKHAMLYVYKLRAIVEQPE